MMDSTNLSVVHQQKHNMFFIKLQHAQAFLNYEKPENGVMDLIETQVPKSARGMGVGKALVQHVFEYARQKHLKIIPTCPFVNDFMDKNPEYEDLLSQSEVSAQE